MYKQRHSTVAYLCEICENVCFVAKALNKKNQEL